MINVINKQCCGDCTKCTLINEVPGFDFYGCVMNQIFQTVRRTEAKQIELEERIKQLEGTQRDITITDNQQNTEENETSDTELP